MLTARFVVSNTDYQKCPIPDKPEIAFLGRSNVGKSSLINSLTNQKNLAKTSTKPGKTQLINHFIINEQWYLVDLPGYGWAKVSKTQKRKWQKMIQEYLLYRPNLLCVGLLIDSRLPPQAIDLELMTWMATSEIPFVIIFTKADKQSKNKTSLAIATYLKTIAEHWEELPRHFITSAVEKTGKEELFLFIEEINKSFEKP